MTFRIQRGFLGGRVEHEYIELGAWKNSALSPSSLEDIERIFEVARNKSIKLIPRFRYTRSDKGDASLQQMLAHIEQLKPILQRNYDVIAILEAGFIGAYGEWWGSSNPENMGLYKDALFKLLDALPKERMVAVRYNSRKRGIYNNNLPITANEAFQGSNKARTAAQNDCFITNEHDAGTYRSKGDHLGWGLGFEEEKVFLSADNLYVSQNGETCREGETSYASCARALTDLKRMEWDIGFDSLRPISMPIFPMET